MRRISAQKGLTFLDLLLVVIITALIGAYAAMQMRNTGENTIWYQGQRMARDIRHVQMLSSTWGRPLQITAAPGLEGSYSVSCVTAGTAPCDVSPIVDPTTGTPFTVSLQHGVTLGVSGTNPSSFDNQGRPLSGGAVSTSATTYTLSVNSYSVVVTLNPISGHVGVTTP